ncbi:unnamed protein product [Spirodela intermedia]|uniref:RING-type E3 ubiquitin transferase n=1 Tax=Spirodela intermedia TaxID=51605 RepID=A0A7I8J879_SPIIN|nr:unnamed protein product [Spirodela intermedia]CAA6666299.1 unnamed protein product [Spirodela intermedia]
MNLDGEWAQNSSDAPLMPVYMGSHYNSSGFPSLDSKRFSRNNQTNDEVLMLERHSKLEIAFEGLYFESKEDGGERVMCLLGSANLPLRGDDPADPWNLKNDSDPPKDEKIKLVVRVPMSSNLTRREIKGDMMSLHNKSTPGYFSKVQVAFRLADYSMRAYKFESGNITAKACSPYPHPHKWLDDHIKVYKGPDFCNILHQLESYQSFTMLPNWICDSTNETTGRCGHFNRRTSMGPIGALAMSGSDFFARAASLFKEVLPWELDYEAAHRTSLSRPIVSSEGFWNSSSGQLCMVACAGADPSRCNLRICLYVPTSFSITQRSTVIGSISSISKSGDLSNFSFSFGRAIGAYGLGTVSRAYESSYEYTMTKQATNFLGRDGTTGRGGGIKKALFKYPRMNEGVDLCRDLMLSVSAFPVQGSGSRSAREFVIFKIFTLGSKFCDYDLYQPSGNSSDKPAQAAASTLNVSAELEITRYPRNKSLMLSLEGLYSQATGKMYLVGCRVAPVPRKTVCNITDWQHLDCEIKVEIQYPPTTLRGLTMPTATVSIESNRPKDKDPLLRSKILSDRQVEVVLRISTLSIVAACILSQLLYVKQTSADAPYVSHVMLGIQALGYGLPLITGADALFTRLSQRHHASSYQYDLQRDGSFQIADFIVKSLVLTAFLVTLRLWQKVWESRIRLPTGVPSDKRVLVVCLILHAVGFLVILLTNPNTHLHEPTGTDIYISSQSPSHGIKDWGTRLEQYAGLMQDFFLLPQVVGNIIWQVKCRPLRKGYYLGITLIRLLPIAPLIKIYFDQGYEFADPNLGFYSRTWDVVIALVGVLLAAVVHFQQRCGCHVETKQIPWLGVGRFGYLEPGGYDRVATVPSESELVPGAMETKRPAEARAGTEKRAERHPPKRER